MSFAQRLRAARQAANLSQKELADAASISVRSIQNYESSSRMPNSLAIVARLAQALNVSQEFLLNDSESLALESVADKEAQTKSEVAALIAEVGGLFAGGELAQEDKDAVLKAIMDAYWDAKSASDAADENTHLSEE